MDLISIKEAKARGLNKYFTGKPCKHGHVAPRRVANRLCCECSSAWDRSEAGKASSLRYALSDKGRKKAKERNWQGSEKGRAYKARYHQTEAYKISRDKYRKSEKGKATRAANHKRRMMEDPIYATIFSLRVSLGARLRKVKAGHISRRAEKYLGCSIYDFVVYIEALWQPGMNWSGQGTVWQLDHIKPLASFDLTDLSQVEIASHYSNFQPLFREEHQRKSAVDTRQILAQRTTS